MNFSDSPVHHSFESENSRIPFTAKYSLCEKVKIKFEKIVGLENRKINGTVI